MASFCSTCGKALAPAQRFCGGCGQAVAEAAAVPPSPQFQPAAAARGGLPRPPAPPPPAPSYPQAVSPPQQSAHPASFAPQASARAVVPPPVPHYSQAVNPPQQFAPPSASPAFGPRPAAAVAPPPPVPPYSQPGYPTSQAGFVPPAPYPQGGYGAAAAPAPAYAPVAAGNLPPAPRPWDLQVKLSATADSILASMNLTHATGGGQVFAWMIRAALLDGRVARMAAADEQGNGKALLALVFASGLPMAVGFLFGPAFGAMGMVMVAVSLLMAVLGLVVAVGVMSALSGSLVGFKLTFGQVFRGLAYAQSPGLLGFIPLVGMLTGLWRLPTSLVAIRDISGADTGKAAVLLIIGGAAAALIGFMIVPVVMGIAMRSLY